MGSPLLVELVGVAGSGKSTVYAKLTEGEDDISPDMPVGAWTNLRSRIALAVAVLVKALPAGVTGGGYPDWRQFRHMARLEGWARRYLRGERWNGLAPHAAAKGKRRAPAEAEKAGTPSIVVLDQGPVFRIAELREFGPFKGVNRPLTSWLNHQLRCWGQRLDLVVWMDADDDILLRRIEGREKTHPIERLDLADRRALLGRYRAAHQGVLEELASDHGVRVIRMRTDEADVPSTVAQAKTLLLGEVRAARSETRP